MQLIIEKDYEQMSRTGMQLMLAEMYRPRPVHMAITGGSTPKRLYQLLAEQLREKPTFERVTYYNFDAVPGMGPEGGDATLAELRALLFELAGIPEANIYALTAENYAGHDAYLASVGGLDAIFMGLGGDGHFCANLPTTTRFENGTHKVVMDEHPELKVVFAGLLPAGATLPECFVTMGPKSVMHARHVVMMATGAGKAEMVAKAFEGPVVPEVPASVFQLHPNFTLHCCWTRRRQAS